MSGVDLGTLPLSASQAAHFDETLAMIAPQLSDAILDALVSALVKHADNLAPGRLYGRGGAGCAVGVMLRELFPATCGPGRWNPWQRARRNRTVRQQIGDRLGADTVRLEHIEHCFDAACDAIARRRLRMSAAASARRVGLWMACGLADERARRDRRAVALLAS